MDFFTSKTFRNSSLTVFLALFSTISSNSVFADSRPRTVLDDAKIAKDSGDSSRALNLYKESLENPQFRDAGIAGVADVLVSENQPDAAIAAVQDYLKNQNPFNSAMRLRLAQLFHHKGDLKSAMGEIAILQKLRPDYLAAKEEKGLILFDQEQYKDAVKNLDPVLSDNPSEHSARLVRAKAYLKLEQKDQAVADLKYLQTNAPQLSEPVVIMTSLLVEAGSFQEAESLLKTTLKRNGSSADLLDRLGDVQLKLGQTREAKDSYSEAIKLNPPLVDTGLKLGKVYIELGEPQFAEEEFKRELAAQPDNDAAEYNLVKLYISQKQSDRIGMTLKVWNQKYPEKAWSAIAYAKSLAEVSQYDQAISVIQSNLKLAPDAVGPTLYLGELKQKNGSPKEALKIFVDAEKRYPQNPEVKLSLGQYYKDIGASSKAVSKLNEISDKDPEAFKRAQEMIRQINMSGNDAKPNNG